VSTGDCHGTEPVTLEIDVNSRWDNDLDSVIVVSGFLGSELESIVPKSYSAGLSNSLQDGRQFIRGEEPGWSILISVWLVEVIQPHSPKAVGPDIDIRGKKDMCPQIESQISIGRLGKQVKVRGELSGLEFSPLV
jgi:hypothetical protein